MAEPLPFTPAIEPMVRVEIVTDGYFVRVQGCPHLAGLDRLFEDAWSAHGWGIVIAVRENLPLLGHPKLMAEMKPPASQ